MQNEEGRNLIKLQRINLPPPNNPDVYSQDYLSRSSYHIQLLAALIFHEHCWIRLSI